MNTTKKHFSWGRLLIGILFIILSLVSFYNPVTNQLFFSYLFAFSAIAYGIWLISDYRSHGLRIAAGVIDILIGIFMVVNIYAAAAAIPYVFAIWFIVDSLFRLLTIGLTRAMGTGYYWFSLILNVLGIIIGIVLLFQPLTAALTLSFLVGFYLMLAGIEFIVLAFSN